MLTNHYRARDYRTARSLCEAFGPYAELTVEPRTRLSPRTRSWIAAITVGVLIGGVLYLVTAIAAGPGA